MNKWSVEVRVCRPGVRTEAVRSHFETWFVADGDDLVFRSPLAPELPVNDHLKWFHGMLEFHRKFIRKLEADGIRTSIHISVRSRTLSLEPEALLLAHQLHLRTEIEFRT
jgi:hypothetical protein